MSRARARRSSPAGGRIMKIHVVARAAHVPGVLTVVLQAELLAPMSLKVHACCCWACSICPLGESKPPCGGQGYRQGGLKRGFESVLNRIVKAVRDGAKQHELQFKRGMLADDTEMGTLAEAMIARLLPTSRDGGVHAVLQRVHAEGDGEAARQTEFTV